MTPEERKDSTPELMAQVLIEMAKISESYRSEVYNQKYFRDKAESESKESMEDIIKIRHSNTTLQSLVGSHQRDRERSEKEFKAFEQCIVDLIKATRPDKKVISKLKKTLEPIYTFHESCSSSSPILDAICEAATKSKKK